MSHDADDLSPVEGEPTPFKIVVPVSADVNDMKKLIHDEGAGVQFAKDLVLWKVRTLWRRLLTWQLTLSLQLNDPILIKLVGRGAGDAKVTEEHCLEELP
jgi:hypothetical protein